MAADCPILKENEELKAENAALKKLHEENIARIRALLSEEKAN